jgi:crossover junction endodeoxyribonuclease RusA
VIVLDLPWPHKSLSPNARVHWAEKARETKKAREWAQWVSCSHGPLEADKLNVQVTFNPPSRRRYDADNLISQCKPFFDGIADSLEVDDSKFQLGPPLIGEPMQGGNVRFEIEVPAL